MKSTSNYPIPSRLWVPEFNNIATNSPVSSSPWKPSKKTSKTTIKTLLSLSLKLASWLVHVSSFSQENKHHIRFRFSVLSFLSIKKMKHLVKSCFSVLFFFNQDNTFSFSFFTFKKKKRGQKISCLPSSCGTCDSDNLKQPKKQTTITHETAVSLRSIFLKTSKDFKNFECK